LTYFELEEYESAKECFKKGLDLLNQIQNSNINTIIKHSKRDINSYIRYIRKCDVEIEGR
jgi:tetratricopeptide (TPR) repeat protein